MCKKKKEEERTVWDILTSTLYHILSIIESMYGMVVRKLWLYGKKYACLWWYPQQAVGKNNVTIVHWIVCLMEQIVIHLVSVLRENNVLFYYKNINALSTVLFFMAVSFTKVSVKYTCCVPGIEFKWIPVYYIFFNPHTASYIKKHTGEKVTKKCIFL